MKHDAIVIGSGPTGVAAAVEGATRGLDVLLVDTGTLGLEGVLRAQALDFHQLRRAALEEAGGDVAARWASARARARQIASGELARIREQLASIGVRVERGPVRFLAPRRIALGDGTPREAGRILLACGSRERRPARFPWRGGVLQDPVSIWGIAAPPRTLLVIGAEESGCEIASLFAALGSQVTLLDRRRRMLRYVDRELVQLFYAELDRCGVEVALGETLASVREVASEPAHAIVELGSGRTQSWDCVVVSAGRVPDLEGLDLEGLGVALAGDGRIDIDDHHGTNVPGVYAAGEAAAGCLQWKALPQEGREAMRHALGEEVAPQPLPMGVHTIPEIAMVGFSEEMCAHLDVAHVTGSVGFRELPLARVRGDRVGMLKLVVEQASRRLLGAHAIGNDAYELIQRGVTALRYEESVDEIAHGAFSSPSVTEAYALAADRCRWALVDSPSGAPKPRGVEDAETS